VLLAVGMMNTVYMNISTFLPLYVKEKHDSITSLMIGIILCMFQVAYLIVSPFIGQHLKVIGRKNSIVIGYLIIVSASFCFGLLTLI